MAPINRLIWGAIVAVSLIVSVPVVSSGSLRSAYLATIDNKLASIWPRNYAFVGNSLTAECNWRWEFGTLSLINLAIGGTAIRDISRQISQALPLKPKFLLVEAGINDVVLERSPSERIAHDFDLLLRRLSTDQQNVVTLIPYVSDPGMSMKIREANNVIRPLIEARRLPIIDLNPQLSSDGVRKPDMTSDGVHLTAQACTIWARAIQDQLAYRR